MNKGSLIVFLTSGWEVWYFNGAREYQGSNMGTVDVLYHLAEFGAPSVWFVYMDDFMEVDAADAVELHQKFPAFLEDFMSTLTEEERDRLNECLTRIG